MQPTANRNVFTTPAQSLTISSFMSKVYLWMTLGILLTGIVAWWVGTTPELINLILVNRFVFFGLIIAEFALVIWLSAGMNRMSNAVASGSFFLYAALNGATLSMFSLIYTAESIQAAFFTTTAGFAGLSMFGYVTKRDLGPVGSFCTMGLFGLIGFGLLSLFFPNLMGTTASRIYGIVGIVVFAGLTAYDTQKLRQMAYGLQGRDAHHKGAILGALKLYLDFINLFLFILRFMGQRRR